MKNNRITRREEKNRRGGYILDQSEEIIMNQGQEKSLEQEMSQGIVMMGPLGRKFSKHAKNSPLATSEAALAAGASDQIFHLNFILEDG